MDVNYRTHHAYFPLLSAQSIYIAKLGLLARTFSSHCQSNDVSSLSVKNGKDCSSDDGSFRRTIDLGLFDQMGIWLETSMTNAFTTWGVFCARRPLPIIILSVGLAAGLCTGIKWLTVTTDPIELWASPTSQSRIERDFFDSTFRPFYRTEQVIIHAINMPNVRFRHAIERHVISRA